MRENEIIIKHSKICEYIDRRVHKKKSRAPALINRPYPNHSAGFSTLFPQRLLLYAR